MIKKDLIFIEKDFSNQEAVLSFLANQVETLGLISNKEEFLVAIKKREEDIPTSVGYGIAMPHGRDDVIKTPFIAFLRVKESFIWDKRNNEEVKMIFLIGVPETNGGTLHLKCISQISRNLMKEAFRNSLLNSVLVDEAYELLENINKNIKEMYI